MDLSLLNKNEIIDYFKKMKIINKKNNIHWNANLTLSYNMQLTNDIMNATKICDFYNEPIQNRIKVLINQITKLQTCKNQKCNKPLISNTTNVYCDRKCCFECSIRTSNILTTSQKINPETGLSKLQECGKRLSKKLLEINPETGLSIAKTKGMKLSKKLLEINPETGLSVAQQRGKRLSKKLLEINPETGLSIAKIRGKKVSNHLKQIDQKTGLSEGQRRARLALQTMQNDIDPTTGLNKSQLRAFKTGLTKKSKFYDNVVPWFERDAYKEYRNTVLRLTFYQNLKNLLNFDKRGLGGKKNPNAYHLDHKYSICMGFKNKIDPNIISSIHNLEMLPYKTNIAKGTACSITIEDLMLLIQNHNTTI